MNLVTTELEHLDVLKTWFPDKQSAENWGGPGIRFPFTDVNFLEAIRWQKMSSWSLLGGQNELRGFGQYYRKAERCHLARLVIAPSLRSKGHGHQFIGELMRVGMSDLDVNECSLFVVSSNTKAINCYTSLNYVEAPYPPGHEFFRNIAFMVYGGKM